MRGADLAQNNRSKKKENDGDEDGDESKNGVPLLMWNQQADLCVSASGPARNVLYLDFAFDE